MGDATGLPKVELHQAFVWTCEDCGRDSFARAVHLTPEEVAMLGEDVLDRAGGRSGDWCMAPWAVTCPHCGARYETEEP